jgi:hypothetical protein
MNERIKELAKEAGLSYMPSNYPDMADLYKGADFELEKFAGLLIQECVSICEAEKADYLKARKGAWDFEEKQIYAEGEAACDTIKYKIKRILRV